MPDKNCQASAPRTEDRLLKRFTDQPDRLKRIVNTASISNFPNLLDGIPFGGVNGMGGTELFAEFKFVIEHIDGDNRFTAREGGTLDAIESDPTASEDSD